MNFEFVAVPDYECSGVVEHYTKVSIIVNDDALRPLAVCSAIVNKKTGNLQRQAKVDKLDGKHIRIAVYGYGKNVKSYCHLDKLANEYGTLTDNEKQNLRVCFSGLEHSVAMAVRKMPVLNSGLARVDLMHYADQIRKGYWEIEHGEYENSVLPQSNAASVATDTEPSGEPIEAEPRIEEAAPIARHTKKVARLVFANGLTEFLNGNLYDLEIAESGLPNKVEVGGHTYYSVLNANGDARYLDAKRISIEEQFTEPPTA